MKGPHQTTMRRLTGRTPVPLSHTTTSLWMVCFAMAFYKDGSCNTGFKKPAETDGVERQGRESERE